MALVCQGSLPGFAHIALACTLPFLILSTLFLGYIDEWRDYYEAYPIGVAMSVDSLRHLGRRALRWLHPSASGTGPAP